MDSDGKVRFRYVGVIDDRVWNSKILPVIEQVQGYPLEQMQKEAAENNSEGMK